MEEKKPNNEASPVEADSADASEVGPSRRELLVKGGKVVAGVGVAALLGNLGNWALSYAADKEPIKIGILHSLSGTMAISEVSLRDTVMMAVEEINAKGGVMGRMIKPVVVDPASNWDLFAEKAKQLLLQDKVAVVFGCWTSVSRKSVLPVFEKNNGLLFYPVQYEGEECSRNVFYTGAAPNQQAVPAVDYLMSKEGGGYKKFYLLGTDYVYPRTTNKILRAMLLAKKVPAANIMEEYTPFHHQDYQTICRQDQEIRRRRRGCRHQHDQRRQQRAVLQGICQPRFAGRGRSDHGLQCGGGRVARDGHDRAGRPPGGVELLSKRRYAAEQEVRGGFQGLLQEEQLAGWRQAGHGRSDRSGLLRRVHLEASRGKSRVD